MGLAVAGRPDVTEGEGTDHPIVREWQAAYAESPTDSKAAFIWNEDFRELRSSAATLSPPARWCLAGKAVVFSAAELRRRGGGAAGANEARQLMTGDVVVPAWLDAVARRSGTRETPEAPGVSVAAILSRANRQITPTFAAVTLLSDRPSGRGRAVDAHFWVTVERILRSAAAKA
jgi:hypothetical protein